MDNSLDLVIVGAGPAGLNAALYAYRAGLNFKIFKNNLSVDSQIVNTNEVENYIGLSRLTGQELYDQFIKHIKMFNINIENEKVEKIINTDNNLKIVKTAIDEYKTKTVIIATGAKPKKLNIEGEDKFSGFGVSYCATCDGAFFKNKDVCVVGGGDTAVEDAMFLSKMCSKVYLIVRKDKLRAANYLAEQVKKISNIYICFNTEILEINGDSVVNNIKAYHNVAKLTKDIKIDGVFIAIGMKPATELVDDLVEKEDGYIVADESCVTSQDGIFACGDVRYKNLRQIITACSDGANAITSVERYIHTMI